MAASKKTGARHGTTREFFEGDGFVAVVEVPAVFLPEDPADPSLEPAAVKHLDEVQKRVRAGDVKWLKKSGAKLYVPAPAA